MWWMTLIVAAFVIGWWGSFAFFTWVESRAV